MRVRLWLSLTIFAVAGFLASPAAATGVFDCGPGGQACLVTVDIDGNEVASGTYTIDSTTGAISLSTPIGGNMNGGDAMVTNVTGNADPILGFNVSAGTGAAGNAFSITLTLPIALQDLIVADSSVSYSLTSLTSAGAQIQPLFGSRIVIAQEVDTSVGGLGSLNKGVDVGNTFSFTGGPQTQNSPVFTASNNFIGNLAYDLMSVTVAFSLSANSQTGISGFVQQVPEPATFALVGLGLLALARRRVR